MIMKASKDGINHIKEQRFIDWGCGCCYYNRMKGCSSYKLGSDGYESEKELKYATCQSWEPM